MPSVAQKHWQEIAGTLRQKLAARLDEVVSMTPHELKTFIDALDEAQSLAIDAACHDELIADYLRRLEKTGLFNSE
jgi:hypothetical protein